jgi:signal transduction histidine kinase
MVTEAVGWAFLTAGIALLVILLALGGALVYYQRRFLALHREFSDGLVRAQEEERAWVAREVHDDVLQRIALLLQEIDDWTSEAATPGSPLQQVAIREELEELSSVLRRLAYRLHPAFVGTRGLGAALERLAADVTRTSQVRVTVRDEATGVVNLSPDQALAAYRIAQEAVNNLVKHARAPAALIRVKAFNGTLELAVEDGGCGFDPESARSGGLGLTSMSERARGAGGVLDVASRPGQGTRVRFLLQLADGRK